MNEYERERIAAAMNQLRPDWPIKSLRTLLSKPQIAERPRRDVTVALAWVACESASHTPARVLEAGPWWRAAVTEGQSQAREPHDRNATCAVCGQAEDRCRSRWSDDHEFESIAAAANRKAADTTDVHRVVETLKAEVQPMTTEKPEPRPVVHTTHGDAARELLSPAVSSAPGVSSR